MVLDVYEFRVTSGTRINFSQEVYSPKAQGGYDIKNRHNITFSLDVYSLGYE